MSETVFVCYASVDAAHRAALARPLAALGVDAFIDVRITPGTDWRAQIEDALQRASVGIVLVSNDLFVSEFVRGTELPALFRRWDEGALTLLAVHLTDSVWELAEPRLGRVQWPLRGRGVVAGMDRADQEHAWTDVALAADRAAKAAPTVRSWLAERLDGGQIRARWRACVPGVPEPQNGGTVPDIARALAMDLVERKLPGVVIPAPAEKPVVRVWIEPIPGRTDRWTLAAWVVERNEVRPLPIAEVEVAEEDLPRVLDRVFAKDCPAPTGLARLEFVADTRRRDHDYGAWDVNDGLGVTPVYTPVVLREAFRVRNPQFWDVLAQRAAAWAAATACAIGPGGPACAAPAQLLDATVVGEAARDRLQGGSAVGVGLLSLPAEGPEREARLAAIIRFGLPVALWSGDDRDVHALLAEAPVRTLREAVYAREATTRRTHLLFDDPDDRISLDTFRSPS